MKVGHVIKRHPRLSIAILGAIVVGAGFFAHAVFENAQRRLFYYSVYRTALSEYVEEMGGAPPTLQAVEDSRNAQSSRCPCPPNRLFPRPAYRPLGTAPSGRYVIMYESSVPYWYHLERWMIECDHDGGDCRLRQVWRWSVKDALREDDRKRAEARLPGETG